MAKKFKFKLENVLKIKLLNEEKIKAELAELLARKESVKKELEFIKSQELLLIDEFKQLKSGTARDFVMNQKLIYNIRKQYKDKQMDLVDIDEKIKKTKSRLAKALKERKVLESLKEKKFEEFKKEENKRIQSIMDELGLSIIRRRKNA